MIGFANLLLTRDWKNLILGKPSTIFLLSFNSLLFVVNRSGVAVHYVRTIKFRWSKRFSNRLLKKDCHKVEPNILKRDPVSQAWNSNTLALACIQWQGVLVKRKCYLSTVTGLRRNCGRSNSECTEIRLSLFLPRVEIFRICYVSSDVQLLTLILTGNFTKPIFTSNIRFGRLLGAAGLAFCLSCLFSCLIN